MVHSELLIQIEHTTRHLAYDERLWLVERLVHGLRRSSKDGGPTFDVTLVEMAADPEMRCELAHIAQESNG